MKTNKFLYLAALFCLYGLNTYCNTNKKIINEFLSKPNPPVVLYISNPEIVTKFIPSDFYADSNLAFLPAKIHNMLSDEEIISLKKQYDSLFVKSLREVGFNVLTSDSLTNFFEKSNNNWKLSLAQITIEERRFNYGDQVSFSGFDVLFDTVFSIYEFNVWFELIPINNDTIKPVVLFAGNFVQDKINGRFVFNNNSRMYEYRYKFEEIKKDDISQLVVNSASTHSDYLFDYFLNKHLAKVENKVIETENLVRFDRNRNRVVKAEKNRFFVLDN